MADQVIVADNPFTRMKGLFGRDEFKKGEALIIKPCNSVHTLFMPFSIDVLFVDKNNQVVKILVGFKPFCFSPVCWQSKYVTELPAGTIQASSTKIGDTLQIS